MVLTKDKVTQYHADWDCGRCGE